MRDIIKHMHVYTGRHIRRIVCVTSLCAVFMGSVSFCSVDQGNVAAETVYRGQVYIETKDGVSAIERLEGFNGSLSVSIDDITISDSTYSENSYKNSMEADEDAVIVDENGNTVPATFDDDWSLILINKKHLIPEDYTFELAVIKGAIKTDARVVPHVKDLLLAAKEDGVTILICSPYRDPERQKMLFARKMKFYTKKGYSESEAYDLASQTVAIPGTSEHEAGLAFDFISDDYSMLDAGFADTDAGRWLKENAADYGFILRYPLGKEKITEIEFEPWHYRYVGVDAAKEIMSRGITLEEYDKEIGITD